MHRKIKYWSYTEIHIEYDYSTLLYHKWEKKVETWIRNELYSLKVNWQMKCILHSADFILLFALNCGKNKIFFLACWVRQTSFLFFFLILFNATYLLLLLLLSFFFQTRLMLEEMHFYFSFHLNIFFFIPIEFYLGCKVTWMEE